MERDDWIWDPDGPMTPLFERESKRRDALRATSAPSAMEARELDDGYLPWAYVGATYHGHPVRVALLRDGSGDRCPFLVNDPNRWIDLYPPLSTRGWPEGPPGWVMLEPGCHWRRSTPLPVGMARFRVLPVPWDVELSRQLLRA